MPKRNSIINIMISSTTKDLYPYRAIAIEILQKISHKKNSDISFNIIAMETERQSGERKTPISQSKDWVKDSDWIVLIVGFNYGWVADDEESNGLSVTELEYLQAIENKEKKILVFIAGEIGDDTNEYNKASEKEIDLKNWLRIDKNNQDKLDRFKNRLSKKHIVQYFKNLDDFSIKLEETLAKMCSAYNPLDTGAFAELILHIQDSSALCKVKVEDLFTYKTIHDQLHEMRQHIIRRIREEILSVWEASDDLILGDERKLYRIIGSNQRIKGKIEGQLRILEGKKQNHKELISYLTNIIDTELITESEQDVPDFEDFNCKLSEFADFVQFAFVESNNLMQQQVRLLADFQIGINKEINTYRQNYDLTPPQKDMIDTQTVIIEEHREQLIKALNTHNKWQTYHDKFEIIDNLKGTSFFKKRLHSFCLTHDFAIIDNEIHCIESEQSSGDKKNILVSLKENWNNLEESQETYETLRKDFDDVFYDVDKRTLKEVDTARDCINAFERVLKNFLDNSYTRNA